SFTCRPDIDRLDIENTVGNRQGDHIAINHIGGALTQRVQLARDSVIRVEVVLGLSRTRRCRLTWQLKHLQLAVRVSLTAGLTRPCVPVSAQAPVYEVTLCNTRTSLWDKGRR